jgi:beta-phosphoglucomutase-like phosphatase (HAD superfamily)
MKKPATCPELVSLTPGIEADSDFQKFRKSYQAFRLGSHRGAKGEMSKQGGVCGADVVASTCFESILGSDGLSYEDRIDKGYAALCEYRIAYRRFRLGAALGSKGEFLELANSLTVNDCRRLPVSQLAQFRQQLHAKKEALLQNDFGGVSSLHLHFGAGRLGLGLILPALLRGGQPFAIVQRPSAAWTHVLQAGQTEVCLNGSALATLDVATSVPEFDRLRSLGKQELLVLSDDPVVLATLVSRSTSYSCSIGGKDLDVALAPLVRALHAVHEQAKETFCNETMPVPAPLYACENDHEAVEKLALTLSGFVDVVPVLVDRVCTGRAMHEDGSIDVDTEVYEGDLVLSPPRRASACPPIPFGGCTVRQPQTAEGASFLHRKKILTVNGTHTTLAFLTLVNAEPNQFGPPQGSYELLAFDIDNATNGGAAQSVGRKTWVWAVARQLILLYEFEDDVIRHTLSGNHTSCNDDDLVSFLLSGARTAVERLSMGGDQTSRVLGGGVENRWRTRLANVHEFLVAQKSLSQVCRKLLQMAGVQEEEVRTVVEQLVEDSARFTIPSPPDFRMPITQTITATLPVKAGMPGVLFDFDGTLGDTEVPAMEVAFWELAPYLPELVGASDSELVAACPLFVRENAGKAFEHMIEKCNKQRSADGMPSVEETRAAHLEPAALLASVDKHRVHLGLEGISALRTDSKELPTLLAQQKHDTVARLANVAQPTLGTLQTLEWLRSESVPFVIATTSGKPRVPVCVDTAGLRSFFPSDDEHIHSGESDFSPPKFKPAPDVYIRAASSVDRVPSECIAVEDSASGVGSASNAGIGLIVGYVGAGHIAPKLQESHAHMLMAGEKAHNKRGADIVISHMHDLPKIVDQFAKLQAANRGGNVCTQAVLASLSVDDPVGKVYKRD